VSQQLSIHGDQVVGTGQLTKLISVWEIQDVRLPARRRPHAAPTDTRRPSATGPEDERRQDERRGNKRSQAPVSSLARTRLDALWAVPQRNRSGKSVPSSRLGSSSARLSSARLGPNADVARLEISTAYSPW